MNLIKKSFDGLNRWLSPLLALLILISSTLVSFDFKEFSQTYPNWKHQVEFFKPYFVIIFFISAITTFLFSLIELFLRPSLIKIETELLFQKRKNEVISENIKNLMDGYLYQLSKKLDFGYGGENTERVTLYIHQSLGFFIPFGRYSANPHYRGPGRSQYPDNEGCISQGWRNGWHFENNLGRNYLRNTLDRYSIPEDVTTGMKMRSELYAVKRIDNPSGESLAVIVVEATEGNRYSENFLKSSLDNEDGVLSELITRLKEHIPQPSYARERGF